MKRLLISLAVLFLLLIGIGCGSVGSDPITGSNTGESDLSGGSNEKTVVGTFEPDPTKDFDFVTQGFKLHIPAGSITGNYRVVVTKSPTNEVQKSLPLGSIALGNMFSVKIESLTQFNSLIGSLLGATSQNRVLKKPAKVTLMLETLRNPASDYFIGQRNSSKLLVLSPESGTGLDLSCQVFYPEGDYMALQRQAGVEQNGLKSMQISAVPAALTASSSGKFNSDLEVNLQLKAAEGVTLNLSSAQIEMTITAFVPFECELKNVGGGVTKLNSVLNGSIYQTSFDVKNQTLVTQKINTNVATLTSTIKLIGKAQSSFPPSLQFKATFALGNSVYVAENLVNFLAAPLPTSTSATLLSSIPADKASEVGVTAQVTMNFSKAIKADTVSSGTIVVSVDGMPVRGNFEVNQSIVKFKSSENLPYFKKVEIAVLSDVWDTDNQPVQPSSFYFTTELSPSVVAHLPAIASGNPVTQQVQVSFSKPMDKNSAASAFRLFRTIDGSVISGSYLWAADGKSVALVPVSRLSYNSTYTAEIGTKALDSNGNSLIATYAWQFATELQPADDATVVITTVPAAGASAVKTDSQIDVSFSRALRAETLTSDNFKVSVDDVPVAGNFALVGEKATFKSSIALPFGSIVKVEIKTGLLDTNGKPVQSYSYLFTTDSRPTLLAYTPTIKTGNPVNQQVQAVFSKPMNKSSVVSNFKLVKLSDTSEVSGTFTWSEGDKTLLFIPSSALSYNATYTAEIAANAADADGVLLGTAYNWQFLTEPQPSELTKVALTSPLNDSLSVNVGSLIEVDFSRNLKSESLNAESFLVSIDGVAVAGGLNHLNGRVTFTPATAFPYSSLVKVEIKNTLVDVDSRAVQPYFFSFTTGSRPAVIAFSPTSELNSSIPINQAIEVTFSKTMNKSQTNSVFQMKKVEDSSAVNGNFAWSSDNKTVIFTPLASLNYHATYSVEIGKNAADELGNTLTASTTWEFVTTAGQTPIFVNAPSITRVTQGSASATCEVKIENGATVSQKGMVWGTSQNPTLANNSGKTEFGLGAGNIVSNITDLNAGTLYYLRAYAVNAAGTAYSSEKTLTTYANTGGSGGLFAAGSGTEANPFQIASLEHFNNIQNGSGSVYILTADINMEDGASGRNATFTGKLDGNNFVIKNYSSFTVFYRVDETSEIRNLSVEASPLTYFLDSYGAIAVVNSGLIASCQVKISVNEVSESIQGPVGGIVGGNLGTIKNCSVIGDIKFASVGIGYGGISGYCGTSSEILECNFVGALAGLTGYGGGGITGYNHNGIITDCSASASVDASLLVGISGGGAISGKNSGYVSGCNASGTITGTALLGGIVGDNTGGRVSNCRNFTNLSNDTGN